ncbi:MAG: diguanylate cyclase [Deltaproteobacteria bacterium]|jgi:diguanylate cyclase (GGDEF)-like protein|nr:diguanylate cyclase [Deltaproteobacteria bacterium]
MKSDANDPIKVLAVDDEEMIRELYDQILSNQFSQSSDPSRTGVSGNEAAAANNGNPAGCLPPPQYDLTLCSQGEDALEAVRQDENEFAMAFIDVRMPPGRDGIWTAENIRTVSPATQIVIVTGYSDIDPAEIEKRVPPPDRLLYLQKPFHPFEIRQFASTLAARWQAEKKMQILNIGLESMVQERTSELRKAYHDIEHQAMHDALTGLLNRRAVFSDLEQELSRTQRKSEPLSLIMADLDHFKSINDTYGHQAGDAVLEETARRMHACVRPYDKVGRIGGEEFMIVLGDCGRAEGLEIAERIRKSIGDQGFEFDGEKIRATVSLGVATTIANQTFEKDLLISAADKALYRAKRDGRNTVRAGGLKLEAII